MGRKTSQFMLCCSFDNILLRGLHAAQSQPHTNTIATQEAITPQGGDASFVVFRLVNTSENIFANSIPAERVRYPF